MIVPLDPRYAATLRTVALTVASDEGFSIDEIDDCQLALTEAFSLLTVHHRSERAKLRLAAASPWLLMRLALESGDAITVEPDELALATWEALVDSFLITESAITLQKTATEVS